MNIKELAEMTGQSENDTRAFLACVGYWMDKGLSFEDAVAKHQRTMERLVNKCWNPYTNNEHPALRAIAIDTFFPQQA